ncbi:hypothetical protein HPB48_003719 [Haemaphysalis longicornis]|uniref:Uncharacterized protein n=1 Tax=Haemaphysalis longicornis TaxID=44386 RepID=A0A9J6FHF7_HAELO|nr:hypothetical protein HPB48_003719 [Haemaphysalis longicornis]
MPLCCSPTATLDSLFLATLIIQPTLIIRETDATDFTTWSLGLWYFVQRTKQCLDFSCTVHLFHLIGCWIYNAAFPHTLSWWLLNTACVTVTCVCGEFLCIRTEMKAIPLSLSPKADL